MNTLVVYDSQYGNTEKIARQIAETLNPFGSARAVRVTELAPDGLDRVDLLIVGSPTQAWNLTKVTQTFIQELGGAHGEHLFTAAFDTRINKPRLLTGSAARGIAKQLRRSGVPTVLEPESFLVTGTEGPLVEGEVARAAAWALELHDQVKGEMEPLVESMSKHEM